MIKGAIFDMDGTLLDSIPAWNHVGEALLSRHGITATEPIQEKIKGMSFVQTAEYLIKTYSLPMENHEVIAEVNAMMAEKYQKSIPLKRGVLDFLKRMEQEKIPMGVATVTSYSLAVAALERLGILNYFQFVITCNEVGQGKDCPKIFELGAQKLKQKPEEIAVFEDSLYCVNTAKNAGFYVVGVFEESASQENQKVEQAAHEFLFSWEENPKFLWKEQNK